MNKLLSVIILLLFLPINTLADVACHTVLWPSDDIFNQILRYAQDDSAHAQDDSAHAQDDSGHAQDDSGYAQDDNRDLILLANKLVGKHAHPIQKIETAGKININDVDLMKSRLALRDADHAAVLALAYKLTQDSQYFLKSKEILLAWSKINQPSGHPINETRLEGFLWAYDLIACQLSQNEKNIIKKWFFKIHQKKRAWQFGEITNTNNHRAHQLKMLLLLDKILNLQEEYNKDLIAAKKFIKLNIDSNTGASIDYVQRNALYYHNYDLTAWLEISLITGCCHYPVNKAFHFMVDKIRTHQIDGEFNHSQILLDQKRGRGGFLYAKQNGIFDVSKTAPSIITYYTLNKNNIDPDLAQIVENTKSSPWLFFLEKRRTLWSIPHNGYSK